MSTARAVEERDRKIDIIAQAFEAHPLLLGYNQSDRMIIAGALAITAVKALEIHAAAGSGVR